MACRRGASGRARSLSRPATRRPAGAWGARGSGAARRRRHSVTPVAQPVPVGRRWPQVRAGHGHWHGSCLKLQLHWQCRRGCELAGPESRSRSTYVPGHQCRTTGSLQPRKQHQQCPWKLTEAAMRRFKFFFKFGGAASATRMEQPKRHATSGSLAGSRLPPLSGATTSESRLSTVQPMCYI